MQTLTLSRLVAVISLLLMPLAQAAETIEEIIVTADFRGRSADELPGSVSVLDEDFLNAVAVQHFEELANVVPNLNWSGDGHRARYFQIRGVGELEQYEGAPNPSVGFLIDDIDFSGIGSIATLYDIESVEVLRGPQGSRYGANALGGLIYVRSRVPAAAPAGRATLTMGDDGLTAIGAAIGGAVDSRDALRVHVAGQRYESNGFRDNAYLGRDDTNGRDETTVHFGLHYEPVDDFNGRLSVIYADIDNGYDAFALDNTYVMLSDKPGRDTQESLGASLRLDWERAVGSLTSITAIADSDMNFGFDADWGNPDSWSPFIYDYVSQTDRSRRTVSQELRFVRNAWLVGAYAMRLDESLSTVNQGEYYDPFFDFADSLDASFGSDYEATSTALFGQYDAAIAGPIRLSAGLRVERRDVSYADSDGLRVAPAESMWGGEIGLLFEHGEAGTSYLTLSRGYKAGGFNLGVVPDGRREFASESLLTLEAGYKGLFAGGRLRLDVAMFASRRDDQQVRISEQLVAGDPASFVFFTINAPGRGDSLGVEADLEWFVSETVSIYSTLGLLDTEIAGTGREQAHAPRYMLAAGANFESPAGWFARLDVMARDAFYFDVSHDQRSEPYELVNARAGYDVEEWTFSVWVRNAFDVDYAVRGFYFGNEPPDFPDTLYLRLGDPRHVGFTIERRFN